MSRGVGDGFVDGAEADGAGAGESKADEAWLLEGGERVEEAMTGEGGGWEPVGVVLRSG